MPSLTVLLLLLLLNQLFLIGGGGVGVVVGVQLKLNENFLCDINENTLYCDSFRYQFMPFFVERKFAHNRIDKLWLRCQGNYTSHSSSSSPSSAVAWSVANFVRENKKFTVMDYNSYITKRDLHELHIVECPIEEQPLSQLVEILFNYNDQFRLKVLNISGVPSSIHYSSSIEQLDHFLRKNEAIVRNLHVLEVAEVQHGPSTGMLGPTTTAAVIELVHLKHLRKLKLINVSEGNSRGSSKPTRTSASNSINTSVRRGGGESDNGPPSSTTTTSGDRGLVRLNSNLLELVLRNNSLMKSQALTTGACSLLLRNLSNLEQLDLSQNTLSADQVENCFQLDSSSEGDIDGDRNNITAPAGTATSAGRLRRFDKLKVLHLDHNRINFRSHKRLFGGDSALKHLEVLSLDHNDIDELTEVTFAGLTNLVVLTLTGNKLTTIGMNAFRPLVSLRQLAMDTNRLTNVATLFGTGKPQNQLLDLNLNGNQFTELPAGIEGSLARLKSLDLGSNRIAAINGKQFFGLTDLLGLRLVDNQLTRITKNAFYLLTSLQIINLSANRINTIEPESFQFNQQLQIVRLDQNQLSMLPKNCFKSMASLLWLNLSTNALHKFYMNELPNSVELLDLHANKIYEIKNMKGPDYLDNLRFLDLAHNHLPLLNEETIPNGLVEINVEDNFITFIEINTFANKNRLTRINLRNNLLTRLESKLFFHKINQNHDLELMLAKNPFDCDCSLEWLMILQEHAEGRPQNLQIVDLQDVTCTSPIQRRRLTRLIESNAANNGDRFRSEPVNSSDLKANIRKLIDQSSTRIVEEHQQFLCKYESHCFTLCQCCDYEATCDCYMKCPVDCNCYYETTWQTNIVDCGQSNQTSVPQRIPLDATVLYLDGNDFHQQIIMEGNQSENYRRSQQPQPHHHLFLGRNKLVVLYLNHSQVSAVTNASLYGLAHLRELHLEQNRIAGFDAGNEFEHVPKLERLYLHDNRIAYIDTNTFRGLHRLQVLTLRRNSFVSQEPFKFLVPSTLSRFIIDGVLADLHVGNEFNCEFNCNEMEEAFQLGEINSLPTSSEKGGDVTAAAVTGGGGVGGGASNVTKHFLLQKFFKSKRANALKCAGDSEFVIRAFIERCEFIKEANQQLRLVNKSAAQGAQDAAFQAYLRKHYLWPGAGYLPVVAVTGTTILFLAFCLILANVFRQQIQLMVFTRCGVRLTRRRGRSSGLGGTGGAGAQLTVRRQSNGQLDLEPLCDAWVLCNERDYAYIESFVVDVLDQMGYYMQITSDWEQLAGSVDLAQRTMLVISSGFLEIQWQNVAFRQALYSMLGKIESRGSVAERLIVVVAVPTELLIADGQLLKLVRSATMVQLGEKRFWDKVRFAMPDVVAPIGGGSGSARSPCGLNNGGAGGLANEANRNNWRRKLKRYAEEAAGNELRRQHPPALPPKPAALVAVPVPPADRSPDGGGGGGLSNEYDVLPMVAGGSSSERSGPNEDEDDNNEVDRDQLVGTMGNLNLHNPKMLFAGRGSGSGREREVAMVNGIDNEQLQKIAVPPRYHHPPLQKQSSRTMNKLHQPQPQQHYHPPVGSSSGTSSQQAYFV